MFFKVVAWESGLAVHKKMLDLFLKTSRKNCNPIISSTCQLYRITFYTLSMYTIVNINWHLDRVYTHERQVSWNVTEKLSSLHLLKRHLEYRWYLDLYIQGTEHKHSSLFWECPCNAFSYF